MKVTVFDIKKDVFQVTVGELSQRLPTDNFFWLDIDGASVEELQSVAVILHLSEPMSSWFPRFGQRARMEAGLTIISAVFLPMTFLTGYFGMSFQWMLDNVVKSKEAFFILGIGLFVAMLSFTLLLFRYQGWLGEKQIKKPVGGTVGIVQEHATGVQSGADGGSAMRK